MRYVIQRKQRIDGARLALSRRTIIGRRLSGPEGRPGVGIPERPSAPPRTARFTIASIQWCAFEMVKAMLPSTFGSMTRRHGGKTESTAPTN